MEEEEEAFAGLVLLLLWRLPGGPLWILPRIGAQAGFPLPGWLDCNSHYPQTG